MGKLTETELKKQLKNKDFSRIYLLYGTEQLYVKSYTKLLIEAVAGKQPSEFNYHVFKGEIDLDSFAAAVQVVPFMSEYNCVVASDVFFDSMQKDELDSFAKIVSNTAEGTVLIISMPSYIPKKNNTAFKALAKQIEKSGSVCVFDALSRSALEKYVAKWANANGKQISRINASKLIDFCGEDLNLLKNEINKICSYSKTEEIQYSDIKKLATVNLETKVFALSDAVIRGEGEKAFKTLDALFYQREEPISMLYVLANSYIDAYRIRIADECGVTSNEVAADFDYKRRAFALDKARRATRGISTDALRKCLDALADADERFKSTSVNYRLAMEQLIAKLLLIFKEGREYA